MDQFGTARRPQSSGLAEMARVHSNEKATMIFDNQCEVKNDPDRDERQALGIA